MGCGQTKSASEVWTKEDFAKYEAIKKLWASIDVEDSGYILLRELKVKMQKEGKHVDVKSMKLAFNLVDADHTGRISFDEFCKFNGLTVTSEIEAHLNARKEAHFPDDPDVEEARRRTDGHGHLKPEERELIEEGSRGKRRLMASASKRHHEADEHQEAGLLQPPVQGPAEAPVG